MIVAPLAIDLFAILGCLVALGIVITAKYWAQALVAIIRKVAGHVPLIGRFLGSSADWVEQRIVSVLADAVNGLEGVIGQFWHALGNLLTSIGHEIHGLAVAWVRLGDYIDGVVRPFVVRAITGALTHGLKWLRKELGATKTVVYRVAKVIENPVHSKIGGAVRTITRPLTANVAALQRWVRARLKVIEHAIDVTIPQDLAWLRSRAHALDRYNDRLWKQVRELNKLRAASVATAVFALAMTRLGLGWLKCGNFRRVGKSVCRMDAGLLEDLLAGSLLVVGGISIAEFAKELQGVMGEAESGIRGFIRETK